MYRDSLSERHDRVLARYADMLGRAERALDLRYGAAARLALRASLARIRQMGAPFDAVSPESIGELDRALDEIDDAIALCDAANAQLDEAAAPYARIGAPSSSAELVKDVRSGFRDPPQWSPNVAAALGAAVGRWAPEMRGEVIMAAEAEEIAIFFQHGGLPFRLELEAKRIAADEDGYFAAATLVGMVRWTGGSISVRPQTLGDELRAIFRVRRDVTFGDDDFDPLYFVSGDEEALRDLLSREVRAAFVRFAAKQPACVEAGMGVAIMPLETDDLRSACAFLASMASS